MVKVVDQREEVEHHVAAQLPGAVADAREQQEARRLDRRRGDDDDVGPFVLQFAVGIQVGDADRPLAARCHVDLGDEAPRSELGPIEQGVMEE